jgi:hypothetical protein
VESVGLERTDIPPGHTRERKASFAIRDRNRVVVELIRS